MSTEVICPVCNQQAGAALLKTPVPDGVVSGLIAHNVRGWKPGDAICLDCLSRMTSAKQELEALFPQFEKQE
ncbi:MAG TPA: hypothetical protein VJX67_20435, partial [Blastocatellia bacterium]|nr:hypothetical protein [Blastocatellia bacterium]